MLEKRNVYIHAIKKIGPFSNKETGEIIEGYNVFYHDVEPVHDEQNRGYLSSKKFFPISEDQGKKIFETGPGLYNVLLKLDFSSNRPRINVEGFEFIRKVDIDFGD